MNHQTYIKQLIEGFAREPGVNIPRNWGRNEEDAVCRWMCINIAYYVLENGNFISVEGGTSDRTFFASIPRIRSQWRNTRAEDIDVVFAGNLETGIDNNALPIKAEVSVSGENYNLRISNRENRGIYDATGTRVGDRNDSILINSIGNPLLWTAPPPRRTPSNIPQSLDNIDSLPECCRNSLNRIAGILESCDALSEMLAVAPALIGIGSSSRPRLLGILFKIGKALPGYPALRSRMRQHTDSISKNRIRTVIELEMTTHINGELFRIWGNLLSSYN